MPDIPANFFTRTELQAIILKANSLREVATSPDQKDALRHLLIGAAELEGVLAELPATNHPNGKALENPNGWAAEWLDNTLYNDQVVIVYGQQILKMPNRPKFYLATGRFRLVLGDETHVSSDQRKLHALLVRYLEPRPDVTPEHKEFLISNLFGGKDAVQEQGTAA